MSRLHIEATEQLVALAQRLGEAPAMVQEAVREAQAAARQDVERIEQEKRAAEREVQSLLSQLDGADEDEDIGGLLAALERAQERVHRCEVAETQAQRAMEEFEGRAQYLLAQVEQVTAGGRAFLSRKLQAIEHVLALQVPGAEAGGGETASPAPGSPSATVAAPVSASSAPITQECTLPDGTEALVTGDLAAAEAAWHPQGENGLGACGTCAIACVDMARRMHGHESSEDQVLRAAIDQGHFGLPDEGVPPRRITRFVRSFFPDAQPTANMRAPELAERLERGDSAIIYVNANWLYNQPEANPWYANHAVLITGTARHPQSGQLLGFTYNDGNESAANHFISVENLHYCWVNMNSRGTIIPGG